VGNDGDREFVQVWQAYDPVAAEMARDALEADGITARLRGTRNAALLGAGQYAMSVSIDVPEEDAPRAEELLRALSEAEGGENDDEEEPDEAPRCVGADTPKGAGREREQAPTEERSRVIALGIVFVLPGLAQVYVRRGYAGLCLILGLGLGLAVAIAVHSISHLYFALVFSMIADVIAGQRGVTALARGERMPRSAQWIAGSAQVVATQIAAAIVAHLAPMW